MTQRKTKTSKKATEKKPDANSFTIPPSTEKVVEVDIVGCAEGMLQNQLSEEAKSTIKFGARTGAVKTRTQKTEEAQANWRNTGHFAKDGSRGHPSESFLKAMQQAVTMVTLSAGKKASNMKMMLRCLSVLPDTFSKEGLPLTCFVGDPKANFDKKVEPAEHWAVNRKAGNVPVPVYRTHIPGGWKMTVKISFDSSVLSVQDVLMLMQKAGSNVGVGSWRKECGGVFGRWEVVGARASS